MKFLPINPVDLMRHEIRANEHNIDHYINRGDIPDSAIEHGRKAIQAMAEFRKMIRGVK